MNGRVPTILLDYHGFMTGVLACQVSFHNFKFIMTANDCRGPVTAQILITNTDL